MVCAARRRVLHWQAVQGKKQLMASFAVFDCDPSVLPACGLFPQVNVSGAPTAATAGQAGGCYQAPNMSAFACSSANVLTPMVMGEKIIPQV